MGCQERDSRIFGGIAPVDPTSTVENHFSFCTPCFGHLLVGLVVLI